MNSFSKTVAVETTTEHNQFWYAWVILAFNAMFLFYKYILQVSPSVMTTDLMRTFHVNGAGLGNLAAMYFYTFLVVQLLVGPLLDRFSMRYLVTLAIVICALSSWLLAHAQTLLYAEFARALTGVGVAFATVSYMKAAADWFPKKHYAFVGGLLATAVGIGAMVGQTSLAWLVQHTGWRNMLNDCALLGLFVAVCYWLFVRDRGGKEAQSKRADKVNLKTAMLVLKNKNNWYLTLYSGLAFSPMAVFSGLWGNPFLQEAYHITKTQAAADVGLAFLGLAVGSPLLGFIADRLNKRFAVMFGGTFLSLLSILFVIYGVDFFHLQNAIVIKESLSGALFLFGFGTGAFMLGFALGKDMNPLFLTATVIAVINTGDAIFGAFTEPLVGKLLDIFWQGKVVLGAHYFTVTNYRSALVLLPLYLVLALMIALPLRRCKGNRDFSNL